MPDSLRRSASFAKSGKAENRTFKKRTDLFGLRKKKLQIFCDRLREWTFTFILTFATETDILSRDGVLSLSISAEAERIAYLGLQSFGMMRRGFLQKWNTFKKVFFKKLLPFYMVLCKIKI